MGLESFYGEKKKKRIPHLSLLPLWAPFSLSAHSAARCLESFHCFPLIPSPFAASLPSPHSWECFFEWPSCFHNQPPFLHLLSKTVDVAKHFVPERCPRIPLLSCFRRHNILSFLSVSLLSSLGVSSSSHLFPSPSEDFSKGSANGRFHLFLKLCRWPAFIWA